MQKSGNVRAAMCMVATACVVGGVGVAGASQRADAIVAATSASTWAPPDVSIETGETVTWDFDAGGGTFHNVRAVDGPAEDPDWTSFTSPPAVNSGKYPRTFTQPGVYRFECGLHPAMTGTITVTEPPVTATPTSSPAPIETATPAPAPSTTPAPPASPSDVVAPAVSKLKAKRVARGARVSFALSEPAAVTLRVKRGKRTVRTIRLSARAGGRSVTLRLARGRYTVSLGAVDAAGNRSAARTLRVTIR